ncbi:bifunctional diguanylate cyclase/phosphodiesterase [Acidiferrobacter thiooxydans]|uniref:Bifunctional diguanylate cyclase/phosphodiesterase n=2 Tax=Acidiferrobacter thiooxydans TaxID=163359 RepID=A0A368HC44_9GAMM|nr:bifunctional diguanylate cyclase/phosphodiesterase [Acidiferrobacter thiooxydans]
MARSREVERLMSRTLLGKTLKLACARSERVGVPLSVMLFSIDRFRLINHRFGYAFGNRVLRRVCRTAASALGRAAVVGRWGNDEFLCILSDCGPRQARAQARALNEAISGLLIATENDVVNVTVSIGLAWAPDDGTTPQEILNAADEALYEAKRRGRERIVAAENLERRIFRMGAVLEVALREDRVVPAYQPIVDLRTDTLVAEEALARIVTTDGHVLSAEEFMEAAGQFRLTYKIDWMILLAALTRRQTRDEDLVHFVNISGDLLRHPRLLMELLASAKMSFPRKGATEVKPLVIEVTERELLENMDLTRERLAPFVEFGVQLALDDFGSGYSSFQYLADLPVSYLKIDGRLISRIQEPRVLSIVRGIHAVAADLGITTLAEYVETAEQVELLRSVGIHWAQGHYFGVALLDQSVADHRRAMSINWANGYYGRKDLALPQP